MKPVPLQKISSLYRHYPNQFWLLIGVLFIDRLGGALLFPFLTLYLTRKFEIGMTHVGLLFAIYMASGFVGNTAGGAMADNFGRKITALIGLVASGGTSLLLGLIDDLNTFTYVVFIAGLFGTLGMPAWNAMVADLLPESKRTEGYGVVRIAANLSVTFGPAIGGILAGIDFLLLFIFDAAISLVAAILVTILIRETRQQREDDLERQPFFKTIRGYGTVLNDKFFMAFILISTLSVLAYTQMNTTLGVYLRDIHGIQERYYGYIISLNAAMVVLLQYAISRRTKVFPPLLVMSAGTILYAVGFSMYGYIRIYPLFLLAMVIITLGEMLIVPVASSLVANLATEELRGRYMAVFGLSFMGPEALGVTLAGLVMDNSDPRLVWYYAGALALAATAGYLILNRGLSKKPV